MAEEVKDMESHLYYKDLIGATQAGTAGLGMKKYTFFNKAYSLVKSKLVSDDIRTSQKEIHQAKAAGFAQGERIKCRYVEPKSLSWSKLGQWSP